MRICSQKEGLGREKEYLDSQKEALGQKNVYLGLINEAVYSKKWPSVLKRSVFYWDAP